MTPSTIAIVGANLAGGRAAEALRAGGFEGRVVLIGDESWLPYERPPLSKQMLTERATPAAGFFLHDSDWYRDQRIDVALGTRVERLRPADRRLEFTDGRQPLRADLVLVATGGRPRRLPLPGADAPNVHHLRTKDDAERLSAALAPGARLVVIGMGVIGAEVAATARRAGCDVTAVEPGPSPMTRTLGHEWGKWLGRHHADRGVVMRCGTGVLELIADGQGFVRRVVCTDGSALECDVVVVGIGIDPATRLAADAGLEVNDGIVVDRRCQTSNPWVFAAGDVANQPDFFGGRTRQETFHNASDQGEVAAAAMLGRPGEHFGPCRFWSDQYDLNIQVVGRVDDALATVVRGDADGGAFSCFFLDDGIVAGMLSVNRAADLVPGRKLVERRMAVDPATLADVDAPLRTLLKAEGRPAMPASAGAKA